VADRKSDFTLPSFDDLFSTQEERDEAKLVKIQDIPISEIDDFKDHPYKVVEDHDMFELVESIKERGIITPVTVRVKEDGRYEMVSGHRRKRACELAGIETIRSEVVDMTRDEAIIMMVESNLQRSKILPSEKAFAYKMRMDAQGRQGKRTDLTCGPLDHKLTGVKTRDIIATQVTESARQIQRYIRLTNLVPELLV
jgi:ParB family chromosome partitioning protein